MTKSEIRMGEEALPPLVARIALYTSYTFSDANQYTLASILSVTIYIIVTYR
jgi:hypothetical protein